MPVLRLRQVHKTYPGPPPVEAIRGVDLDIDPGEMVAIVGPSGSGKTTLLHLMGGLDRPSSGLVEINGVDVSRVSDRELSGLRAAKLGFVFQEFFLLAGVTALDNVAQGLVYRAVPPRDRRKLAAVALEKVGLGDRMTHLSTRLSGGERQRVGIARAIVGDPAIVFADEPTGNLDSVTSEEIVRLLLDLNAGGSTIVVITHDLDLASRFPRRVSMRDGNLL
ncbi:MAG: ABC transporter ATP-binding protein [Acidimicrobiia bacterium]|nr:ABC transporter ATP-binding protein [Acidimicrobiia bacterium]MDH4307529.1 ABC transporter ATP-binding protein [Acidimicrobiia bacterium]